MLTGKCVVLGVTGGIAAYKAAELASRLVKMNARVRVVMTEHATKLIAPLTFESITGAPAYVSLFDRTWEIEHIALAKSADIFVVAPATANALGKFASGIADDLLTTTFMAVTAPVLLAPAMNTNMWKSAANQHNLYVLRERGCHIIGPESGRLACGDNDIGRMSEPESIAEEVKQILAASCDLSGRRVMVTAGPTRESIDPVRYLTNHSSGKMGYAIAEAAARRGAEVVLVSGPVSLTPPAGVEMVQIVTTAELHDAVVSRAVDCDAVIQAAAPADFRPAEVAERKIKRTGDELTIRLIPNPDIAARLGRDKWPGQVLVAFAAETDDLVVNARKKLISKNADLVVANDVTQPGAGFHVDTNRVTIVSREGETVLPLMSKRELADRILNDVVALIGQGKRV